MSSSFSFFLKGQYRKGFCFGFFVVQREKEKNQSVLRDVIGCSLPEEKVEMLILFVYINIAECSQFISSSLALYKLGEKIDNKKKDAFTLTQSCWICSYR